MQSVKLSHKQAYDLVEENVSAAINRLKGQIEFTNSLDAIDDATRGKLIDEYKCALHELELVHGSMQTFRSKT